MTQIPERRPFGVGFSIGITILAFGILLLSLLWGGVVLKVRIEEKAEFTEVTKHTANLARAVEEHAVRTIREADQVLLFLQHQYRMQGSKPDLRQLIEDGPILSRIYTYLSIIDEHGNLAAGSQPFKPVNLSDREHFQVHVARDILNQPFISKPVVGRASGKSSIQITRRINKPDLSFGGVAVVSIDPDYLSQFYSQLDIGKHGVATLVGRDGIVRAQRAGSSVTATPDTKKWTLFKQLETSESGSYLATDAIDGQPRIFSYRSLPDYPLVVVVGVATDDALADFYQRRRNYYQAAALASLVILGFTAILLLMVSRQEKTGRALRLRNMELGRASEASSRLAAIVESSNDAIISRALDRRILTWNSAAERLFGWTAAEAIGQTVSIFIPPERAGESTRNQALVQADQPVPAYDTVRLTKDGRRIDVSLTHSPIKNELGETDSVALVFRDITERKRAEDARARLAAIVENSSDAIISRSPDGKFASWNKGAERMFGYTAAEAIGQPITLILPPEERNEVARKIEHTRRGEAIAPYETKRVTKDGRIIDVVSSVSPIRDATGTVTSVSIIFHDISAIKRAEAERTHLAAIVENANDAIIGRTLEGIITSWNAAAEKLYGYTAAEAIGQPVSLILPPGKQPITSLNNQELVRNGYIPPFETKRITKDGRVLDVANSLSPVRDTNGRIVGAAQISRDITDLKKAQRELVSKSVLSALMEALARAVNEAQTPADALTECLERICEHGGWRMGHLVTFAPDREGFTAATSVWKVTDEDRVRLAPLIERSEQYDYTHATGPFVSRMLVEQRPKWIEDLKQLPYRGRFAVLRDHGFCSLFGFPVVVRGRTIALLQFFADTPRPTDALLLENIANVSGQLARAIERGWATTALSDSEARLRAILDNEPECVKVLGTDGTLVEMNRAGLAMLEVGSVEQARELGLANFIAPEHRQLFNEGFRKVMSGQSVSLEFEIVGARGTRRWLESRAVPMDLPGSGGRAVLAISRDVTEHKQAQEQIAFLSQYDSLTGLPNRNLFRDRLGLAIARAKRQREMVGIMLFNLDRFKQVNEGLGLEAGDTLLRQVAARLKDTLRGVDTIARLGGDEFAILVEGVPASADVTAVAEKLIEAFAAPFTVQGTEVVAVPSIGITTHPNGSDDSQVLLEHAETAMGSVKREGGGGYRLYASEPVTHRGGRLDLETRLRHALDRGELALHYQPKVRLRDGIITGAEALLRWDNPELGSVGPAKFIPIAEESGLIVPIGAWVLETACAQAARWRSLGHDLSIAVNLSPRQFRQKDLISVVTGILERSGLEAQQLELEITEGTAMRNAEQAVTVLNELHRLGVKLAVDDFGTGYSSLSYLKRFPLHCLKIDRSFVSDAVEDHNSEAIVRATVALAHSLNLKVIAEGVETEPQRNFLAGSGCDEYQGYFFSRPVPPEEFGALLKRGPEITLPGAYPVAASAERNDRDPVMPATRNRRK